MIYTSKFQDLTGQRFGRLTVVERANDYISQNGHHTTQWLCKCACGNEIVVMANNLKRVTKSCGCYKSEITTEKNITHGVSDSRLYNIWCNIKQRCYNKNNNSYKDYGGRGIIICDEWLDFEPFYEWAMDNGYNDDLTIDRVDNNGNYEPSNCRWVDIKTQSNNKRNNHYITYNGKTQTLAQWSDELNINYNKLWARIKYGWSIDRAFNE